MSNSDHVSDERRFLHEFANPLGTATLLLDTLEEELETVSELPASTKSQIRTLKKLAGIMRGLLDARRDALIRKQSD